MTQKLSASEVIAELQNEELDTITILKGQKKKKRKSTHPKRFKDLEY